MGGMTSDGGDIWPWIFLWVFLALAVGVAGGIGIARALGWRKPDWPQIEPGEPSAAREASNALRLRYAHGEISREDYLQGKVELED
jgi:uncharacterized membrane protein